ETRRGERLVHRRVKVKIGVALGYVRGMASEEFRPSRVQQMSIARTAAMMTEACYGANTECPHPRHAQVMPCEVRTIRAVGGDRLPKHRITQRADSESGDPVEIF